MKFKKRALNQIVYFLLLVICLLSFSADAEIKIPSPTTYKYANDYSNVMDQNELNSIISIGKELEDKTGTQAVVVTLNSTNNVPIEEYAINLFRNWGIGQKGKDNGLLILLAINDRAWRVEVGRGLEGVIPDALSNRVMESIGKPKFINGQYGEGLINSYSTFCNYIASEYNVTLEGTSNIAMPNNNYSLFNSLSSKITIGVVITLFLLDTIFNRGRISYTLLQLIFWNNIFRGGGPRNGSSGGGGFGGFGGGSSSGGGSSGNW